ncbi:adenylate cyclase [Vibrio sp. UCD-FRSSP16_10]|uniref:class I adenylate cyclase n=1 Tax=unclassified Vibrio TaxID=2614977 RepID=UPI0007FFAA72|nr:MULTISPECIES: class I adenylate cyclase [unclassified Vibrio]OBT10209.1 adenylate cyclase [Vibrio sp. UCD-FRSSP16_30]OBT18999.1 adenylate cyclase [Vibrio sp. UCD-FRSSP16_10]
MQAYTHTLIARLDTLNEQRTHRALGMMDAQGRYVFSLIPLLFHYNHPALPGYVSDNVPQGIFDYCADTEQLCFLENSARSYGEQVASPTQTEILALYTMGSTSSIGQSLTSDLDIWVCISPEMSTDKRSILASKCLSITEWAQQQGVEANFFLMDDQRFKVSNQSEAMTGENCGSSQHMLLLDEFYRSAMRMAGQRLLWSIVPPEMEECYDQYIFELCNSGEINCNEWLDFGQLNKIPAEEYFGSSLWQLFKSIDSPYKSVLKAILLEAYSWEYPQTQLLSIDTKRRFFMGDPDLHSMDAYYVMLEKVTRYLEMIGDQTRLDLVRRCFYLKTHEKLSQTPKPGSVPWRRKAMQQMTLGWGWSEHDIQELDTRRDWKVERVKVVHHNLLDALMESYRNLIQFARRNDITSVISPQDISILARKLYAAFEVLPGKVTLLNQQISPDLHESDLSFIQVEEGRSNPKGWYLYKQSLEAKHIIGRAPIEHHRSLSKLVAWAFFNGLITESTRLHSVVRSADIDIDKLYQMVSDLRNTFSLRKRRPTMEALASPCEISQLVMFINLEDDPTAKLNPRQAKKDGRNVNLFSCGKDKTSMIGSVDLVYRNSWHEVRTLHFRGDTSILDALKTVLGKMHQDALHPESVDVFCYSQNFRGLMRNTVYQLLAECIELRLKPVEQEKRRRFKAIGVGSKMYGLFFERRGVSVQTLENSIDFYQSISTNKLTGSPLEKLNKENDFSLPDVIDGFASEGLIQFFFEDTENGFNIYVLDESNIAEAYHRRGHDKNDVVGEINNFYTNDLNVEGEKANFNLPQYYQIIHQHDKDSFIVPYRSDSEFHSTPSAVVGAY